MKTHIKYLKKLGACNDAIEYAAKFETLQQAWDRCERGGWMLWLLGKQSGPVDSDSRKHLVFIACQCARISPEYIPKNEMRPLIAIQTAEKYAQGKATLEEVKVAASAASAAYAVYAADSAVYASKEKTLKKCADIVRKYHPKIEVS